MPTDTEVNAAKTRVLDVLDYLVKQGAPACLTNNGAFLCAYLVGASAAFAVTGDTVASGFASRGALMAGAHDVIDHVWEEVESPAV